MKRKYLSMQAFRECPVWAFDDDQEARIPVDATQGLPLDLIPLFVGARLITAAGRELPGYVVASPEVYALGVVDDDDAFVFNLNLPDRVESLESTIRQRFRIPEAEPLFPIAYETAYGFPGERPLAGSFPRPD